jgi:hypothetical protein
VCWSSTTACSSLARAGLAVEEDDGVVDEDPVGAEDAVMSLVRTASVPPVVASAVDPEPTPPDEPADPASSSSFSLRAALAAARLLSASLTSASRVDESMVAIVWPAVTFSPLWTSTVATVPATWKSAVAALTGSMLPETVSVRPTEEVVTAAVR